MSNITMQRGNNMSRQKLNQKELQFIEKLYKEYHSDIMDYVSINMFNINNVDYESIVQDTFFTAMQKVDNLIKHANPRGWLIVTARNKMLDTMKRKMTTSEIPTSMEELDKYESYRIVEEDGLSNFDEILTQQEIELLQKRWVEGYTIEQIAKKLSTKPSTVGMRLSRIYNKIKKSKIIHVVCVFFLSV